MAHWLVKEEPTHYSFDDFVRDKGTLWNGVHNALALRHLKSMRRGEEGFYYHTGDERAIVGTFRVAGRPEPDPEDDRGSWRIPLKPGVRLPRPVPLAELRPDPSMRAFDLVRISRLSIMPVAEPIWKAILRRSRTAP
ncbi:MAG: EVE domain-containing protein [Thermoplasmata archaeon]|nr:EVE domain-containing protein [Thermoplasmata archaeon]